MKKQNNNSSFLPKSKVYIYFMKKTSVLPQKQKQQSLHIKSKSKSPIGPFRKIPTSNALRQTPPKYYPLMGVTFSTKTSTRTLGLFEHQNKGNKSQIKMNRNMTLEMQDLCRRSDLDNGDDSNNTPVSTNRDEDEYFELSLAKVLEIRSRCTSKISNDLKQVLNMIKQEKLKIGEKMKILKKNNEYYKKLCEGEPIATEQIGVNTMEILDCGVEINYEQESAQVNPEQLQPVLLPEKEESVEQLPIEVEKKMNNTYIKLCSMLDGMNIDFRSILPEMSVEIGHEQKEYKSLSDDETIKIQKFFIGKLASRLKQNSA